MNEIENNYTQQRLLRKVLSQMYFLIKKPYGVKFGPAVIVEMIRLTEKLENRDIWKYGVIRKSWRWVPNWEEMDR